MSVKDLLTKMILKLKGEHMGIVKRDDIAAAYVGEIPGEQELVCAECLTKEEWDEIAEADIVTQDEIDKGDELYFCDRCKKQL